MTRGALFYFLVTFAFLLNLRKIEACNGYKTKLHYLENCDQSSVIKVAKKYNVELTKDCELIANGCIETTGFQKAYMRATISKNGMVVHRIEADLCDTMSQASEEAKHYLRLFGLPDKCPVAASKNCQDSSTKADISKYKRYLALARGLIQIEARIEHENGKTCIKAETEITK
uniref:Putative conserved secreted protein n=1 Tax=Lutzomyia longipalpis TaxID=7200 RepID=A0A1B0CF53_LUTLO